MYSLPSGFAKSFVGNYDGGLLKHNFHFCSLYACPQEGRKRCSDGMIVGNGYMHTCLIPAECERGHVEASFYAAAAAGHGHLLAPLPRADREDAGQCQEDDVAPPHSGRFDPFPITL